MIFITNEFFFFFLTKIKLKKKIMIKIDLNHYNFFLSF